MKPRVTVVTATIPGREDMLARALRSVDHQTLQPEDVIIVLDEKREGAAATRNRGLTGVETELVAWLDDDDQLLPRHLEACAAALADGAADLAYPGMIVIGMRDPLATSVNGKWVNPFGVEFGPEQEHHLRTEGNFIPVTYVVRTELVRRAGGFPEPWGFDAVASRDCEDYGLLLALLRGGARFRHVPERTWIYNVHGGNVGGRGER